jgi:glutaconate CoA-transferase subunit A
METIQQGTAEIRFTHPDAFRERVRQHKRREMVEKLLSEREAIARFVADGDYIAYDFSSLTRGPQALVQEIIRQRRQDLWICAEFTLHETALLVGGGCASRIDVGFLVSGNYICRAVSEGRMRVFGWTNGTLASRMLAAARGVPFIPVRTLFGTDTLRHSGARVVHDPFTGDPIGLVPASEPGRVPGPRASGRPVRQCQDLRHNPVRPGSRRGREEGDPLDRRDYRAAGMSQGSRADDHPVLPGGCRFHLPFGAYPAGVQARYRLDLEHIDRLNAIQMEEQMQADLSEYVFEVEDHAVFLERKVGWRCLQALTRRATTREGYH